MTAAYILIQMNATDPRTVMATIRAVAGVKQAHLLMGPIDCIAYVETDTLQIHHQPVNEAKPGDDVGMKAIQKVHPHDKIFKLTDE